MCCAQIKITNSCFLYKSLVIQSSFFDKYNTNSQLYKKQQMFMSPAEGETQDG